MNLKFITLIIDIYRKQKTNTNKEKIFIACIPYFDEKQNKENNKFNDQPSVLCFNDFARMLLFLLDKIFGKVTYVPSEELLKEENSSNVIYCLLPNEIFELFKKFTEKYREICKKSEYEKFGTLLKELFDELKIKNYYIKIKIHEINGKTIITIHKDSNNKF